MFHLQILLHSAGVTTDSAFQCFLCNSKGKEPEVHLSRKEREIQAPLGTPQVKTCAMPVVQSFAAELSCAESFLLRAEDDTVTTAKKSETERMSAPK